jgi:hypothetical protein
MVAAAEEEEEENNNLRIYVPLNVQKLSMGCWQFLHQTGRPCNIS